MGRLREQTISAVFWIYNLFAPRLPVINTLSAEPLSVLGTYFDAIWVLTIPRNMERREFVRKQLAGLPFEFFEGVDGKTITEGDTRVDLRAAEVLNRRSVRVNELACTMSHLLMFKKIMELGLNRVLIFEDDTVFLKCRERWIPYCLSRLPADWELVYLGYRDGELRGFMHEFQEFFGKRKDEESVVSRGVGRGLRTAAGHDYTNAYAVTREGARKLLEDAYPVSHTADGWLESKVLSRKIRAYICVPKIFDQQEDLGSSIHRT
jgi:glycosyl transferase, family 25